MRDFLLIMLITSRLEIRHDENATDIRLLHAFCIVTADIFAFSDKDVKLVVGCQAGNRSKSACFWLDEAGYKNVVENGTGYAGWSGAGLPTE